MIYLACILAYLFVLAGIGLVKSRQVKNQSDFAVAGRSLSPWVMVCTMLAVWIGTGSIVGNAEQTYETGMAALLLPTGTVVGMILLAMIATRARQIEASTVPEIIERRFGPVARNLAMTSLVIAYMVIVSYQFNAGGAVLEVIVGDKPAVERRAGDELSRRQLVKGRLVYTPTEDWTGATQFTVAPVAEGPMGQNYLVLPIKVGATQDAETPSDEDMATISVKRNSFARLRFDPATLVHDRYVVTTTPDHGSLDLVEPILTAGTATLIAAAFIISYAALAGLMSLAYMDLVTGSIIMLTMVVAFPVYLIQAGGIAGMERLFGADGRAGHMQLWGVYSPVTLVNYILPVFLLVLGDANQYQRIFASRNAKGARVAVIVMVFAAFAVELLIIACAWIASSMTPDPENGKYILIYAARHYLVLPLGCLFMVTVVAIIISTADSFLHVPATTVVNDLYVSYVNPQASQQRMIWMSRLLVVVFGAIAYVVTLLFSESTGFFQKALYAFTIYGSSITPTLIAAIVWRRATKAGAISSICAGAAVTLIWSEAEGLRNQLPGPLSQLDAVLPAILISTGFLIVVSLLTKPEDTFSQMVSPQSK